MPEEESRRRRSEVILLAWHHIMGLQQHADAHHDPNGSREEEGFDASKYFRDVIRKRSDESPAIAAVRTLLQLIKIDKSGTMQELIKRLKDTIPELKGQNASTVSVHSGCELLIQFITRAELECNEFQETRRVMLNRGDIFLANVKSSRGKIAKLSGPFLTQKNVRILTHSRSRVVLAALDFASSQNQGCLSVFVTESQPDRSGKEMVKNLEDLKRDNLSARMILDASVAQALEDIDLVLLGAEGVVENGGIINKIGTLTLATCAKAAKKPVYVLVESFKFIRLFPLNQRDLPDEYKYAPFSSKSEPVAERTPMADYTPPDLISLIISDLGILTPSAVSDKLIELYL